MLDLSRLTRLLTCALVSCAATWALAGAALAQPIPAKTDDGVPAYQPAVGDAGKAEFGRAAAAAPAFKPAVGDASKAEFGRRPAFRGVAVDHPAPVNSSDDNTVALVFSIVAMLIAIAAVAVTVTRPQRPVLRA